VLLNFLLVVIVSLAVIVIIISVFAAVYPQISQPQPVDITTEHSTRSPSQTRLVLDSMDASKQLSPPGSPYEELSLDTGPTPQDPWSTTPLPTSGESGSGPSVSVTETAVGATTQSRPDLPRSLSTASTSGFNTDGSQIPLVLGVAVVDFNHLVRSRSRRGRHVVRVARP
jgi:hypothetical protein